MEVLARLRLRHAELTELRRDLHAHPELAFAETRTAAVVANWLERCGIEVHRGIGGTGVVGVIRGEGGAGPMVGLRADMDALPLNELNTFEHVSRYPGRMHGCGHDGHTAMLLAAAAELSARREFAGTLVLVFQPAEEGEAGARAMIEDGLFERFPVERIFGMHNWPGLAAGTFAVHHGPVMAGTDRFDICVSGVGGHGAMPHRTIDPVVVAAQLISSLQTIVSRTLDPLSSGVLSVTRIHGGEAYNVIPDRVELAGTVRYFDDGVRATIERRMHEVCEGVARSSGARIEFDFLPGYPPTINSALESELCVRVASRVVGADKVLTQAAPSMGAEDFAFFLREKPGCYVWIGNGAGEGCHGLHNPHYDFNDEIIPVGGAYWVELAHAALRGES